MPNLKVIMKKWERPTKWLVCDYVDSTEVSDQDGDFVVSSVTQNNVIDAVEEHREKVKTEAVMKLLLDLSEDHEA